MHETRLQSWTASPTPIILRVHSSTPERSQLRATIHVLDFILWQVDFAASYFRQCVIASGLLLKPLCEATTRKGRLLPVAEQRLQATAAQLRSLSLGVGISKTMCHFLTGHVPLSINRASSYLMQAAPADTQVKPGRRPLELFCYWQKRYGRNWSYPTRKERQPPIHRPLVDGLSQTDMSASVALRLAMYFTQEAEDAKEASRCYQTRHPLYCTLSRPTAHRAYCQNKYGYLEVCNLIGVQRRMVELFV